MAIPFLTLIQWWKRNDKPTQEQVEQTFNSFRHKDDSIPVGEVNGINELLLQKADKTPVENHLQNVDIHITADERITWNNKLDKVQSTGIANRRFVIGADGVVTVAPELSIIDDIQFVDTGDADTAPDTIRLFLKGGATLDANINTLFDIGALSNVSKGTGYNLGLTTLGGASSSVDLGSWFAGLLTMTAQVGSGMELIAGVARNIGGTWGFIVDGNHQGDNGVASVTQNDTNGTFTLNYNKTYVRVVSMMAKADNIYVNNGIEVGTSVNPSLTIVNLKQDTGFGDYVYYNGSSWVSHNGVFDSISYSNGILTLNHSKLIFGHDIHITPRQECDYLVRAGSSSQTVTTVYFFTDISTQYTGAPNANMKLHVGRKSNKELLNNESDINGSNVWFAGVFEKA